MVSVHIMLFATLVAGTCASYLLPDSRFFMRHCIGPGCPEVSYPEPLVTSTKESVNCTDTESSVLSDPSDCQIYYVCHNGTAHKLTCTVGYAFHPRLKLCVPETLVKSCGKVYCPPTVLIGMVPDPKNCTRYYRCVYGVPLHYQCGKGYSYDKEFGRCRKYGTNIPECLGGAGTTTEVPLETTTQVSPETTTPAQDNSTTISSSEDSTPTAEAEESTLATGSSTIAPDVPTEESV